MSSALMQYEEFHQEEEVQELPKPTEPEVERILIDSLPYLDSYDEASSNEVNALIQQEMARFPNSHRIAPVEVRFLSDSLNEDWKKVEKNQGQAFTNPLMFDLPEPSPNASIEEWQHALEWIKIQYEYVKNKQELLQLQQQFGANSWMEHNKTIESLRDRLKKLLDHYKQQIERINIQRKAKQMQASAKLASLTSQWQETTRKNLAIDFTCQALEQEIRELEKQKS